MLLKHFWQFVQKQRREGQREEKITKRRMGKFSELHPNAKRKKHKKGQEW